MQAGRSTSRSSRGSSRHSKSSRSSLSCSSPSTARPRNSGDDDLDRLRFGLVRLQVYADIHRYEDMEAAQRMKYVAATIERVLFGRLLLEGEEGGKQQCC
ncbi:hypothetical protein [Methanoculleus chikugoensis]|uniref:hypothetical protein n=1 Tax=Methanoculleus chikugoensis TaxID=118126 RepID=UPI000A5F7B0C|nr:hypothetical protein [Methanoculleus chikugoensis]